MNTGLPMLYGWLFFAFLGGAVGFVIGWMCCNSSWHRYQARQRSADALRPQPITPERLKQAGQKAMREMRERNPDPIVTAADVERARALAAPSYSDDFSGCGADPLPPASACHCEACMPMDFSKPQTIRMIVCSKCGNKRCPHATDHRNACTNSNEPGQKGSSWENYPTPGGKGVQGG